MMRLLWLLLILSLNAWSAESAAPKKFVLIGDSLTEGYGVARDQAYPALVQKKLGDKVQIINASISGSTSASAPSRMKWQLKSKPDLILLALGANDGLRGLPVDKIEENLSAAIALAEAEHIKVILGGMYLPPNYGAEYTAQFKKVFKKVADKHNIPMIPFLLNGVAGKAELNQADGIHPNEKGHAIVADTVYQAVKKLL